MLNKLDDPKSVLTIKVNFRTPHVSGMHSDGCCTATNLMTLICVSYLSHSIDDGAKFRFKSSRFKGGYAIRHSLNNRSRNNGLICKWRPSSYKQCLQPCCLRRVLDKSMMGCNAEHMPCLWHWKLHRQRQPVDRLPLFCSRRG